MLDTLSGSAKAGSLTKAILLHLPKRGSADGTSTSRISKPSKMREILRGPANLGSGEDADFARLHGDGANNQEPILCKVMQQNSALCLIRFVFHIMQAGFGWSEGFISASGNIFWGELHRGFKVQGLRTFASSNVCFLLVVIR